MTTMAVEGRRDPEHDGARADQRVEAHARPVRGGGEGELVRAGTPNWANVESANVLQSMLSGILRNPGKTKALAKQASAPHHADPERLVSSPRRT